MSSVQIFNQKEKTDVFVLYIKQDPQSLIHKFFQSRKNHETSKDWVTSKRKDLKQLNINGEISSDLYRDQNYA